AAWIEEHLPQAIELYRHFHSHPELSFHEEQTAARFAAELRDIGCEVTTGVGGHGVVGILENGEGPRLMLRADLDALPVSEETNLVYASKVRAKDDSGKETGVMHACGHDIHMTNLLTSARYLAKHKQRWRGTLMFIGQPAEEKGGGAQAMLNDGLFKKFPKPDMALALHVDSTLAAGKIGYRAGYALANVDSVDITVKGRGGHGAYPHGAIDPVVIAAHLILDLQTIVSREIKPTEPAVITVGSIHGGTKHNVIGDTCHLQLTVRCYSPTVRKHLHEAIERKAKAVAMSHKAPEPKVEFSDGTPAMFNDEKLVERVVPTFERVLGEKAVVQTDPSMGGEDFSEYGLAGVPIFMYWLGSVDEQRLSGYKRVGQAAPSLHSPLYYPDSEATLRTGVISMCSAVLDLLPVKAK
ncbi:MAG: amidohydrolase, partial [Planctomycetaceae bacterium]|nr:amidohydrolase [Planctomycetaceae bacterium]